MPRHHLNVIPPQGRGPTNMEAVLLPSPSQETTFPPNVTRTRLSLTDTHFQLGAHKATTTLPVLSLLGLIIHPLSDMEVEEAPCPVVMWTRFRLLDPTNGEDPLPLLGCSLSGGSKHRNGAASTHFTWAAASASEPNMIEVVHTFIFALLSHV